MTEGKGNGAGSRPSAARGPRREATTRDAEVCPRCGRSTARIIGRSEFFPVLYLRCDECRHTSVAPL